MSYYWIKWRGVMRRLSTRSLFRSLKKKKKKKSQTLLFLKLMTLVLVCRVCTRYNFKCFFFFSLVVLFDAHVSKKKIDLNLAFCNSRIWCVRAFNIQNYRWETSSNWINSVCLKKKMGAKHWRLPADFENRAYNMRARVCIRRTHPKSVKPFKCANLIARWNNHL